MTNMEEKKSSKDIKVGDMYGYLKVLEKTDKRSKDRHVIFKCECTYKDCGNITYVCGRDLISGNTTSCGCKHNEWLHTNRSKDLSTSKFTKLSPKYIIGRDINNRAIWHCICDCGNECDVSSKLLLSGNVKSCGCLVIENYRHLKEIATKHGLCGTKIYRTYYGILDRCYNKNKDRYQNYGGRGIKVCDEWLDSENGFMNFYNWAMSHGYRDDLTIERVDVNGPYAPWNCKWIPKIEQYWNKQDTIRTIDGYPIAQFAYNYGIPLKHIRYHNPDVESITVEELYERYFWPNGEPIIW